MLANKLTKRLLSTSIQREMSRMPTAAEIPIQPIEFTPNHPRRLVRSLTGFMQETQYWTQTLKSGQALCVDINQHNSVAQSSLSSTSDQEEEQVKSVGKWMFMNGSFQRALLDRYVQLNKAICLADVKKCEELCSLGMYKKCLAEIKQHQRLPLVTVSNQDQQQSTMTEMGKDGGMMRMEYQLDGGKCNLVMLNFLNNDRFWMGQCVIRVRGQLRAYIERIGDGSVVAGSKDLPSAIDDRVELFFFMPKNNSSSSGGRIGDELLPETVIPVDSKTGVPNLPWRISRKSKFLYKHQLPPKEQKEQQQQKDQKTK